MKVPRNLFDWIADGLCVLILIGTFGYIGLNYSSLPDQVPTGYDFSGNIRDYGDKITIWIMPAIALFLGFILIVVLEQFPQAWNTGIKKNTRNLPAVYRASKDLMNYIKLANTGFMCLLGLYATLLKSVPIVFVVIYIAVLLFATINYVRTYKALQNTKYIGKKSKR